MLITQNGPISVRWSLIRIKVFHQWKYDVISTKQMISWREHGSDTASLRSPESHCVLVKQKQPIGNVQPETRSPPQRASHRPQSRDTPRVLLIQAGREPRPAIQPFSANTSTHRKSQTQIYWPVCLAVLEIHEKNTRITFLKIWNIVKNVNLGNTRAFSNI